MDISWRELLWEGETIDGEFMRGQLFRFNGHYYICNNIPHTYEGCIARGRKPPEVGWWHEVKPDTLKKCEWEEKIGDVYYKNGAAEEIIACHSNKNEDSYYVDFITKSGKYHYEEYMTENEHGVKYKIYQFRDSNFDIIDNIDFIVLEEN